MTNRVFRMINRFIEDAGAVMNAPSRDQLDQVGRKPKTFADFEGSDALFERRSH